MNETQKKLLEIVQSQSATKMKNIVNKIGTTKVSYNLQAMKKKGLIKYDATNKVWKPLKGSLIKPVKPKTVSTKKMAKPTKKGFVQKVKERVMPVQNYGTPKQSIAQYEPIEDFDPSNPPEDFIIVKMGHRVLDEMLIGLTRKKAQQVGVPCRRVK